MASKRKATIKIEADTKQAKKGLGELDKSVGKLEKSNKSLAESFTGVSSKVAAAGAAIGVAAVAFGKLIGLANEQEDSIQKLNAAFGNLNGENAKLIAGLEKQTEVLSALAKGGDEEVRAIQATIGLFVKEEETVKALTQATLDFAIAKGIDAVSAADLLTRTLVTENNALLEQGVVVEGAAGSVERFNSLMQGLTVFQGQAAAAADTTSGKIRQLTNAFTDFLQALAGPIASAGEFTGILGFLTDTLNSAAKGLDVLAKAAKNTGNALKLVAESILPKFLSRMIGVEGAALKFVEAESKLRDAVLEQGAATEVAAKETTKLKEAQDAATRAAKAMADEEANVTLQLEALGVVLESTTSKEITRLNTLLDAATIRFDSGKLSAEAFASVQILVARNIESTNEKFETQGGVLRSTTDTQLTYVRALQETRAELGLLTPDLLRNTQALEANNVAVEAGSTIGGRGERLFEGGANQGGTFSVTERTRFGTNGIVDFDNRGGIFAR